MDANITAIIIALAAALPGLFAVFNQLRKDKAQIEQDKARQPIENLSDSITVSSAAAALIRQYSDEVENVRKKYNDVSNRVDELERKVREQERTLNEWRAGIDRLVGQVVSLGHAPVWKPTTGPLKEAK